MPGRRQQGTQEHDSQQQIEKILLEMQPDENLPVESVVNSKKSLDTLDVKSMVRYEPDQTVLCVTLKVGWDLVLWL